MTNFSTKGYGSYARGTNIGCISELRTSFRVYYHSVAFFSAFVFPAILKENWPIHDN